jgi:hypothetical protein
MTVISSIRPIRAVPDEGEPARRLTLPEGTHHTFDPIRRASSSENRPIRPNPRAARHSLEILVQDDRDSRQNSRERIKRLGVRPIRVWLESAELPLYRKSALTSSNGVGVAK